MTDIYVRTTGNDSTGTGATGAPYATLKKALTVAASGDFIFMGPGTYAEDSGSGYLAITAAFSLSARVTICSESGFADDVIITGTTGAYAVVFGSATGYHFDQITFRAQSSATSAAIRFAGNTQNLLFSRCRFQAQSSGSSTPLCVGTAWNTSGWTPKNIRFARCKFEQQGVKAAAAMILDGSASGVTVSEIEIRDCDVTVGTFGIRLLGIQKVRVHGNSVDCFNPAYSGHAFQLGVDGSAGAACSGWVVGNSFRTVNGHAGVIGSGCNGVDLADNRWYGGVNTGTGQGLVLKECQNVRVEGDRITGGYLSALYLKAAVDTQVFGCTIINEWSTSPGIRVQRNAGETDNPCQRLTVRRNVIIATDGTALNWGGASDDSGGSICDENVYVLRGSAALGSIRGTTVTKLTELRSAWAGYDRPVNDRNSKIGATRAPFAGTPLIDLPA